MNAPTVTIDPKVNGPKVLLMGPAGTGKTYSLGTICELPFFKKVAYLGLEQGIESLYRYFVDRKAKVPPSLAWHNIDPPKSSFSELKSAAEKIATIPMDTLLKMPDANKAKYDLWEKMLSVMADFEDQRTGEKLGAVDDWGNDRCFIIDGMTGLNRAIMSRVVGSKPIRSPQDWGVAQDQLEAFFQILTTQCRCWVVILAHVEREVDQILGGSKISVSTLGKALPPKIPTMFSDVVLTTRQGTKWTWDTANGQADIKTRNLEWKAEQAPTFAAIFKSWSNNAAAALPY